MRESVDISYEIALFPRKWKKIIVSFKQGETSSMKGDMKGGFERIIFSSKILINCSSCLGLQKQ